MLPSELGAAPIVRFSTFRLWTQHVILSVSFFVFKHYCMQKKKPKGSPFPCVFRRQPQGLWLVGMVGFFSHSSVVPPLSALNAPPVAGVPTAFKMTPKMWKWLNLGTHYKIFCSILDTTSCRAESGPVCITICSCGQSASWWEIC